MGSSVSTHGNCKVFWVRGHPWGSIGPHWPYPFTLVVLLLAVLGYFAVEGRHEFTLVFQLIGFLVFGIGFSALLATVLLNPGIVLRGPSQVSPYTTPRCDKCNLYVPVGAVHCTECRVCIMKIDHHCPLLGKCIGQGNLHAFHCFLGSLLLGFGFLVLWVITRKQE